MDSSQTPEIPDVHFVICLANAKFVRFNTVAMDIIYSLPRCRACVWATVFLMLLGPVAYAQGGGALEKLTTSIDVAVSDTVSGMNLLLTKVNPLAQHGDVDVILLQAGGAGNPNVYEIRYTPDPGFTGLDTFTFEYTYVNTYPYLVYRGYQVSVFPSIVTAKPDFAVTSAGTPVTIDVLNNDSGLTTLSIGSLPLSDHGTATFNGNEVTFTPAPGYTGIAHVNYTVCDSLNTCKTQHLSVGVHGAGNPQSDTIRFATTRGKSYDRPLLHNGYELFQAPSNGQVTIHDGLAFTYQPSAGFTGSDQFTLSNDSFGQTIYKTVLLEVLPRPNQNRMAVDDIRYTPANIPVSGNVRLNDIGNLTVKSWVIPPNLPGTVSGTNSAGNFTFTPNNGFQGVATFYYRIGNMFAPNLEMAAVRIVVGNLKPQKSTYELTTPKETPMVVNYELPFSVFEFNITDQPDHGVVTFHPGFSSHVFGAETVSGVNLLIYEPDPGYTGPDQFEMDYCVTANSQCEQVKVEANVVDVLSANPPFCLNDCVWAGDINNDGIVNNLDILPLGYAMGLEGSTRPNASLEWFGQGSDAWEDPFLDHVADLKYADTDGNGIVDHNDTLSVGFFYGLNHQMQPFSAPTSKGLPFELDILTPNPGIGDLVQVDIYLGDTDEPVTDLYGFTFDLSLSPDIVDSAFHMQFEPNAWTNINASYLTFQRRPSQGRLETAFTRTSPTSIDGFGYIGRVEFIIIDVIEGGKPGKKASFTLKVDGPMVQWGNGEITQSDPILLEIPYNYIGKANYREKPREPEVPFELLVYPNPARDLVNLRVEGTGEILRADISDSTGRQVYDSGNVSWKANTLPLDSYATGMYFLRLQTTAGTFVKKIQISR